MTENDRIPKIFPDDIVLTKIYLMRDNKVMIDKDLAELYGIETKRLKEAVRRNRKRFPEDFMFEMSKEELENWRTQYATSNSVSVRVLDSKNRYMKTLCAGSA